MASCCGSRRFGKWWTETTDVHVLSSPWVRRPMGRGLRISWMVMSLGLWIFGMSNDIISKIFSYSGSLSLQLILMWYFWAASLWIYCQSSWESISGSFLFALGGVMSFRILSFQDAVLRSADFFGFTGVLLFHSSLHPVAVLPNLIFSIFFIGFRLVVEGWKNFMDPIDNPLQIYSVVSTSILLVLFTLDFTKRVKIAVTIMNLTEVSESDTLMAHQRSPYVRICAGVAGVSNWIFWAWIIGIKRREHESWHGYDMWANHLPKCSMAAPLLGTACLPLFYFLRRSPLAVDILLAIFCCLPGVLSLADFVWAMGHSHDDHFWRMHSFTFSLRAFAHLQALFALQTLLLAECHPFICMVPGGIFGMLSTFTMTQSLFTPDTVARVVLEVLDNNRLCCFLYCFQIVSHAFDYFSRKRALIAACDEHNDGSVQLAQLDLIGES
eukprot:Skav208002  [mRNA]  locus=scaffold1203:205383:206699:+ [translate_table: standard]